MTAQGADGADRLIHHRAARVGLLLSDICGIGGLDRAARDFLGGGEHFVHGGSDLINLGLLPLDVARAVPGQIRHAHALAIGFVSGQTHTADHLSNLPQQAVVRQGDHAHLVIGVPHLQRRGKVALADPLQTPPQLVDLQHQPVHSSDPSQHDHQQDAQGRTQGDPELLRRAAVSLGGNQQHHFVGSGKDVV